MKLYCDDCLNVMQGMEASSVDAIVTDPGYFEIARQRIETSQPRYAQELNHAKPA